MSRSSPTALVRSPSTGFTFPSTEDLQDYDWFTATATDPAGNTSEFSADILFGPPPPG